MSDVEVVRALYQAMAAGDLDAIFRRLHPDIVITQDPALPWGGRFVGHDGFATFGLGLRAAIDSIVTTEAVFAADGDVIQFGRTRGAVCATGARFDIAEVHRWTVVEGMAVAAHFSIDTAAMLDRLAAPGDRVNEPSPPQVCALDHVVLICSDIERSLAWYLDTLGLEPERVDEWRRGEAPFPSVRIDAGTIIDLLAGDSAGERLDHLCVVIEATDLDALSASGRFDVLEGPSPRYGARGMGRSLYVRDPDGTTVELRHY